MSGLKAPFLAAPLDLRKARLKELLIYKVAFRDIQRGASHAVYATTTTNATTNATTNVTNATAHPHLSLINHICGLKLLWL